MVHGALASGIEAAAEPMVDSGITNLEIGDVPSRHIGDAGAMRA
jgi:hypothetical protein